MKPIETEDEYDAAIVRIEKLMDQTDDPRKVAELEALADVVEAYEDIHYPMSVEQLAKRMRKPTDEEMEWAKRVAEELKLP
jgi:antitoxin component HigA of HigAB toxin-antitoxin module